jgi:hypothetical protein
MIQTSWNIHLRKAYRVTDSKASLLDADCYSLELNFVPSYHLRRSVAL